jgi:trehalose 6-phosphate phosphatase
MAEPILPPPPDLAGDAALLLDFDGTLVALAETPGAIRVAPGLADLLGRLASRLGGRLALVTGRAIADLEARIGPLAVALAGSHGLELRTGGKVRLVGEVPAGLAAARRELAAFAAADPRLLLEDKPGSVALHYRRAPELAGEAVSLAEALALRHGLRLQAGKMVVELVPPGVDKGAAVRRLMAEPPFAGARPVFVGDDLTDEHGFEAAAALGGGGILVGPQRETAARWRLAGVDAVHAWLEAAAHG